MITSRRINLANLQDNDTELLNELFKAFNDTDAFKKDDEFEIDVTGSLTDEQYSFLEEACAEEIQERKDQRAFERDMEDTEKWLINN